MKKGHHTLETIFHCRPDYSQAELLCSSELHTQTAAKLRFHANELLLQTTNLSSCHHNLSQFGEVWILCKQLVPVIPSARYLPNSLHSYFQVSSCRKQCAMLPKNNQLIYFLLITLKYIYPYNVHKKEEKHEELQSKNPGRISIHCIRSYYKIN